MAEVLGHISQIIGPVVDVHFEHSEKEQNANLPSIHDALKIQRPGGKTLTVEVQQHIGEDTVRTIAMDSTDGLQRGMKVVSTGKPITMPVGAQIRGRVMNVVGEAIDGMQALDETGAFPIHRDPPKFEDLSTTQEVLVHGHQSDRPVGTLSERRKNRIVRWGGRRKNGINQGAHQQHCQKAQRLFRVRRCGRTYA